MINVDRSGYQYKNIAQSLFYRNYWLQRHVLLKTKKNIPAILCSKDEQFYCENSAWHSRKANSKIDQGLIQELLFFLHLSRKRQGMCFNHQKHFVGVTQWSDAINFAIYWQLLNSVPNRIYLVDYCGRICARTASARSLFFFCSHNGILTVSQSSLHGVVPDFQ